MQKFSETKGLTQNLFQHQYNQEYLLYITSRGRFLPPLENWDYDTYL